MKVANEEAPTVAEQFVGVACNQRFFEFLEPSVSICYLCNPSHLIWEKAPIKSRNNSVHADIMGNPGLIEEVKLFLKQAEERRAEFDNAFYYGYA